MAAVPENLLYDEADQWVRTDGGVATVGITDYAAGAVGTVEFLELPPPGKALRRGEEGCVIESSKAAFAVEAPVSGTVVGINTALEAKPGLVASDCYGRGWLYKIELADQAELSDLMTPRQYVRSLLDRG